MLEENNSNGNNTYLYIIGGNISKKVNEGEGVERENKNGAKVWEKQYRSMSGIITSFSITESQVGEQLQVNITDAEESYILQMPVESSYFSSFAEKIANVKLSEPVEITTYSFIPDGKTKRYSGVNFKQNGEKVEKFITREVRPEGYPEPKGTEEEVKNFTKDQWKLYFMEKTIWEKKYISTFKFEDVKVSPQQVADAISSIGDGVDFDGGTITGDEEVPF